jgi:hypothetical protein
VTDLLDTEPRGLPAIAGAAISPRVFQLQKAFNELLNLYGHAADQPRPGETDERYMRRALQSTKRYSEVWSGVDFDRVPSATLPSAFRHIVSDGVELFKRPVGPLREVVTSDAAGRRITRFYGDPECTWAPFKGETRRFVTAWDTAASRGKNAPGARVAVSVVMSDGTTQPARDRGSG